MSWNYRVMKYEDCLCVVEAYYNAEGDITGYTNPIIVGEDKTDLLGVLQMMKYAVDKADTKDGHEVLETSGNGKFTQLEQKLQEALELATDCYVTVLANNQPDMTLEQIYDLPEVKKWYGLADMTDSLKAKQQKAGVL